VSFSQRLPSLTHRDFRNFQIGSFVSNVGTMIQSAAIFWHVYHITGSSLYVGLTGIVRVVPLLILSLFGGVIADHYDRRRILLYTQISMAATALLLAFLTITHRDTIAGLYIAVALSAVARAFNGPARQAMMASLVPAEHFPNAASINGIVWRLSDVIGPAIAGVLIGFGGFAGVSGLAMCYLVNAVSFLAVIYAIYILPSRPGPEVRAKTPREVLASIAEGIAFLQRTPVIWSAMWLDFWATLLSGAEALLPAFAAKILHVGPEGYGFLAASTGIGALLAASTLAWLPPIRHQGRWVISMIGAYGLATILFGLSPNLWLACLFLGSTGAADMISTVLRQTIRQLATPDSLRGRMSSATMITQVSGPQLGDFEAGALASAIGERASIVVGGVGSLVVALWWQLRGKALREYEHDPVPIDDQMATVSEDTKPAHTGGQ
jgi:MFS family permease